jgi:predicted aconitase
MLDGGKGEAVRQSMELIVEVGKVYEAERLLPIRSVHMSGASVKTTKKAGRDYICWVAGDGNKFVTTTTVNPASDALVGFQMGVSETTMQYQRDISEAYCKMGAMLCHSCTPYQLGNIPKLGEHIAWGESSAIAFSNSVLGARTNREGGPSCLASALTGYTADYGLHKQENRYATIEVKVECELNDRGEYGAVGYYVGRDFPDSVPLFTGLPQTTPTYGLKQLAASLPTAGSVALFHVEGVTPEARTYVEATGGRKIECIKVGRKEIEEATKHLNESTPDNSAINCAFVGCPHLDFEEIIQLVKALEGRHVHKDVSLWLFASQATWSIAERSGMCGILEEAGATLISDTCPAISIFPEVIKNRGFTSAATDSAKQAHILPVWGMKTHFGTTTQVLEAAIAGKWEDSTL